MFTTYEYIILFISSAALTVTADTFGERVELGTVTAHAIIETSGIAVSRVHPDIMYTQNDKGDSSHFYAVDIKSGKRILTFEINGISNYDWEDLAYGPCVDDCAQVKCSADTPPSRYCIYIADTGDHDGDGATNVIYMVREPSAFTATHRIEVAGILQFSWPEMNAETLMISPEGELFIISRANDGRGLMAPLPSSAWGHGRVSLDLATTATLKISTGHNDPTGGAISPDGKEMVLVANHAAYYYSVPNGDYVNTVRTTVPVKLPHYEADRHTEAVSWSPDGQGFYVLAEGTDKTIYFYPKTGGPLSSVKVCDCDDSAIVQDTAQISGSGCSL